MSPEVDIMLSGICVKVKVTNGMSTKSRYIYSFLRWNC